MSTRAVSRMWCTWTEAGVTWQSRCGISTEWQANPSRQHASVVARDHTSAGVTQVHEIQVPSVGVAVQRSRGDVRDEGHA